MNNRLNLLRKTLGLTQNELGLKLGLQAQAYQNSKKVALNLLNK